MYPFNNFDSYNFFNREYSNFLEASMKVGKHAMEVYTQAWNEFFFSPQTLVQRNMNYFQEVMRPPHPTWHTPHCEVALPASVARLIKLLDFSDYNAPKITVPTLVLPPQAGHHSCIADYSDEQSQVKTLRSTGLSSIYCIEWLGATQETRFATIEDYIETVRYSVEKIGGKVNLMGDCQGGWLAAIYAALYPETVNSLVVAGAPIDFQAGDGQIKQSVNFLAETYPDRGMAYYRNLVSMGNGVLDGRFLVGGFNVMKPEQLPERFLGLYQNINDPKAVHRFREITDWYDYSQNISGAFYLWLVEHLFRDNELVLGKLKIGGKKVDLGQITCPVYLLGGTRDHITPPVQVFALADYVSTAPEQIKKMLVKAGHVGLFMGHEVLAHSWTEIGHEVAAL